MNNMQQTPKTPNMIKMVKMLFMRDFLRTVSHFTFLTAIYTRITFLQGFANIFIDRANKVEKKFEEFINQ